MKGGRERKGEHLHSCIWICSLYQFPLAKNHNFVQILSFGALLYRPLLPMRVKFVVLEQTQGLHLHTRFHFNMFIVSASSGRKPQFGANFDILAITELLLPTRAKFSALEQTHGIHLGAKFHLDRFIMSSYGGEKPQFLLFLDFGVLWCRHLAAVWESWTRLHNYKPSPIQLYQNRFCTPRPSWQNRAHKLWRSKAWWTNRQTKKTHHFWLPQRRVKSEPHQKLAWW